MIKSKSFYLYQTVIHIILILISLIVVVPIILLFISSISSEKSLIVNGYSFFLLNSAWKHIDTSG